MDTLKEIVIELPTYVRLEKVCQALRELYEREQRISDEIKNHPPLVVSYYGLTFNHRELNNNKLMMARIKDHLKHLNALYRSFKKDRAAHCLTRIYQVDDARDISQASHLAYHYALKDIAQMESEGISWTSFVFKFRFNNEEFEFNPLLVNGFSKLTTEVRGFFRR